MDFRFTREQNDLREKTIDFVKRELPPEKAREIDERDVFPFDVMQKMADEGFWAINVPREYGGDGGGIIELMIFNEEISKACPTISWTAGDVLLYGNNILKVNGSDAQRQKYYPGLMKGALFFCFALTEPDAGSDASAIETRAERVGDHFVINGSKMFISGASAAHVAVVNTRTGPHRTRGITSFLVDTRSEGYSATPIKKLGYRGSDTCEVYFKDVRVSADDILGGEECFNQGWHQMMRLLNGERLTLAACALGISEAVLADCIAHVKERKKASKRPGSFQNIEHQIADMACQVEAARRLAYYGAWMMAEGIDCIKETSMTKVFCAETGKKAALLAMELMGAHAYSMASNVQRFFRDVPILSIGGGTSQIQKNVIAKMLGL